jgi:flavin-dependent dehydrogenase
MASAAASDLACDVLVAGAGPAGAAAALTLAPARRVVLVGMAAGRARSGESLASAARHVFADLGLCDAMLSRPVLRCHGHRAAWGSARVAETDFLRDVDGPGWLVDRAAFDDELRAAAVARGARLITSGTAPQVERAAGGFLATLQQAGTTLRCRADFVIDATGRRGRLARQFGAVRLHHDRLVCGWLAGTAQPGGPGAGCSLVEAAEYGWWFTAPVPQGRRVVAFYTDADLPAAHTAADPAALLAAVGQTREIRAVLEQANFCPGDAGGFSAAHGSSLAPCFGPGWLAAGDAALSLDPLAGQGLYVALFTGHAAGRAAAAMLNGETDAQSQYAGMIARTTAAYRQGLAHCYALEHRWPQAAFWRRRQPTMHLRSAAPASVR